MWQVIIKSLPIHRKKDKLNYTCNVLVLYCTPKAFTHVIPTYKQFQPNLLATASNRGQGRAYIQILYPYGSGAHPSREQLIPAQVQPGDQISKELHPHSTLWPTMHVLLLLQIFTCPVVFDTSNVRFVERCLGPRGSGCKSLRRVAEGWPSV